MSLKISFVLIFINHILYTDAGRSASFPIGGLFNELTLTSSLQAFEKMVPINGTKGFHGLPLDSKVVDSYSAALELCSYTSNGIVALLDARPTNGICDSTCLLCNRLNITHLSMGWESPDTLAEDLFTFSYHPPAELISKAYATLINSLQWDKFTILYEDESSFIRLQEVINTWPHTLEPILFRKLYPNGDNKETFKHIFKVAHMNYHVLDCDVDNTLKYLQEITEVNNSTEYQSLILTNLNSYTLNLQKNNALMANVSTLHLTASNDVRWKDIGMGSGDDSIKLESALVADALYHIEKAIRSMQTNAPRDTSFSKTKFKEPPSLCIQSSKADYEELAWPLGSFLRDALLQVTTTGFTGNIQFDEEGKRTNFLLHYSKLNKDSNFIYDGYWESKTNRINTNNMVTDRSAALKSNAKIRVATKKGKPYFDIVESPNGTIFQGYAVDLIDEIFSHIKKVKKIDLEYEIYRVQGDKYGNLIAGSKKWDGIIGDLIDHKADLAICDITITSERNAVVDFSIPFMTLGISMLFREPDPVEPDMFSFIEPLSLDVWLYLATTYIIVSFVLLVCARMSQDDWVNPHPCNHNPESLQNIWSLYNCMWLTMGSIMTQGCDILPRAAGSRWITGMWWFFALIVTASYTANMSTFLSDKRRSNEIKDIKALSEQNKVSYGAVYNASTYRFFESSNDSVYEKIWSVMDSAKPTVFTKDNDEGVDRVKRSKGNYAFFMESTAIEYFTKRNCELKMVGPKLDSKEYGIAMPKKYFAFINRPPVTINAAKGSKRRMGEMKLTRTESSTHTMIPQQPELTHYPHKGLVDNAILSLQESGRLDYLKKKWWEEEDNDAHCEEKESDEEDNGSLQMKNTSGIFLVLGVGGVLGFFVAIIDFLLNARQISVKERVTFQEAVASEWRASLNPRELHRLAAPPRSAPPSTATPSPRRDRSQSRAVSVLRAASSFINFDEIY